MSEQPTAAAEPQRSGPSVTSTTVAGIGPAALSLMRGRESAKAAAAAAATAAAAPAAGRVVKEAATQDAGREPLPEDKFSALPAALRDLSVGTRKTLVGIIAPSVLPTTTPVAAPLPQAVAPAPPATAAIRPVQSLAISGTPCRSIDDSEDDEAMDSVVPLRRLGNATVPYPRPRAASRAARAEDDGLDELGYIPQAPQSWRNRTSNTLRVVLTDPDHRPHLVAGLLVCSAAALVIFALGRSPVSGTGLLGQTTGSLSGREATVAEPSTRSGGPSRLPAATPSSGSATSGGSAASGTASPAAPSAAEAAPALDGAPPSAAPPSAAPPSAALPGEELAPGLVVPPRDLAAPPAPPPPQPTGSGKATSPLPAAPLPSSGRHEPGLVPGGPASGPLPTSPPLPTSTPPRATPQRKPGTESPLPRPANPDFDFGI